MAHPSKATNASNTDIESPIESSDTTLSKRKNKTSVIPFDIQAIKTEYEQAQGNRELFKYLFSIATFGLGALYLFLTTRIVKEGEISLRQGANGSMTLLPPGRHSNFPWESYARESQSLAQAEINLGPYKIIRVDTGFVAQTSKAGKLVILDQGTHLITDPSHTFQKLVCTKQTVKELKDVKASTRDSVSLTLMADVRYVIENPELALSKMTDVTHDIGELAKSNLANIVLNHSWNDFAQATSSTTLQNTGAPTGVSSEDAPPAVIGNLAQELTRLLQEALSELGVRLMNISITGMEVNDNRVASELAQAAVARAQTESQLLAAENARQVKITGASATATATRIEAESLRDAVRTLGTEGLELLKIRTMAGARPLFFPSAHGTPQVQVSVNASQQADEAGATARP